MHKSTKAICAATLVLMSEAMLPASILSVSYISSAQAQEEYIPTKKDFVDKWKLSGSAIRPPRDMKDAPTPEQEAAAAEFQPGDPTSGACVWCGTWSFSKSSLWLELDTAPRLDIYAKGGDIQMTYTAEPDEKSKYAWLVFGWTKAE